MIIVGGIIIYKCVNKVFNGMVVNVVIGVNVLVFGYGCWINVINISVVDFVMYEDMLGIFMQWLNFSQLVGCNNMFILGGVFDYLCIMYDQIMYLVWLINYQVVVIFNQVYGFIINGLVLLVLNLVFFMGSNVIGVVSLLFNVNNFSVYFIDMLSVMEKLSVMVFGSFNYIMFNQGGVNNKYLNGDGGFFWMDEVLGVLYYNFGYVNVYWYLNFGLGVVFVLNGILVGVVVGLEINSLVGLYYYYWFNLVFGFNYDLGLGQGIFGSYSELMCVLILIELFCVDLNSLCLLFMGFNGDLDLKVVIVKIIEFGGCGKLGKFIYWSVFVYDLWLSNDIQFIVMLNMYGYFVNVGKMEWCGFELGVSMKIDKWLLLVNFGYVDVIYKLVFIMVSGQNVVSGNKIFGIFVKMFKFGVLYVFSLNLLMGGNVILVSKQIVYGNESNVDLNGEVVGYGFVNLNLYYKLMRYFEIFVYISNLFNKCYFMYGLFGMWSIYMFVM